MISIDLTSSELEKITKALQSDIKNNPVATSLVDSRLAIIEKIAIKLENPGRHPFEEPRVMPWMQKTL